jgi:hypothetical protein
MNRWDAEEAVSLEKRWGYRLTMGKGLSAPQLRLRHIRLENSHCENRGCFFFGQKIYCFFVDDKVFVNELWIVRLLIKVPKKLINNIKSSNL